MNFSHEGELTLNNLQSIIKKQQIFTVNSIHKDIAINATSIYLIKIIQY